MATARSTTLPRKMKSVNPVTNLVAEVMLLFRTPGFGVVSTVIPFISVMVYGTGSK